MTFLHYTALSIITLIVGVLTFNVYKVIVNPSNLSQDFASSVKNLTDNDDTQDWRTIAAYVGDLRFTTVTEGNIISSNTTRVSSNNKKGLMKTLMNQGDFVHKGQHIASLYPNTTISKPEALSKKESYAKALNIIKENRLHQSSLLNEIQNLLHNISTTEDSLENQTAKLRQLSTSKINELTTLLEAQNNSLKEQLTNIRETVRELENEAALISSDYTQLLDSAHSEYKEAFTMWLGAELTHEEELMDPDLILSSWGADFSSIFIHTPNQLNSDLLSTDRTDTRWNELLIKFWGSNTPNSLSILCRNPDITFPDECLKSLLVQRWNQIKLLNAEASEKTKEIQTRLTAAYRQLAYLETQILDKSNELSTLRNKSSNEVITALEQNIEIIKDRLQNYRSSVDQVLVENDVVSLLLTKNTSNAEFLRRELDQIDASVIHAQITAPTEGIIKKIHGISHNNKSQGFTIEIPESNTLAIQFTLPNESNGTVVYGATAWVKFPSQKRPIVGQLLVQSTDWHRHLANKTNSRPATVFLSPIQPYRSNDVVVDVKVMGAKKCHYSSQ